MKANHLGPTECDKKQQNGDNSTTSFPVATASLDCVQGWLILEELPLPAVTGALKTDFPGSALFLLCHHFTGSPDDTEESSAEYSTLSVGRGHRI